MVVVEYECPSIVLIEFEHQESMQNSVTIGTFVAGVSDDSANGSIVAWDGENIVRIVVFTPGGNLAEQVFAAVAEMGETLADRPGMTVQVG